MNKPNNEATDIPSAEQHEAKRPPEGPDLIHCLDHGFVRLVDSMGDDHSIVQSARVSYGKGTKSLRADRGLIRYLMKHRHTTPFEMVEFKFHCKMPIFVARQWIRHRTANVNEISGRYSIMEDTFWEPTADDMRTQSLTNRQGSNDETISADKAAQIATQYRADQKELYKNYQLAVESGVAREIARVNLPVSLYTEWYWKIDLHNLLHFLSLRMDAHAQKEIRVFAEAMGKFVRDRTPLAWEAFEEFKQFGGDFSRSELALLRDLIREHNLWPAIEERRRSQLAAEEASDRLIERELAELQGKLK